MHVIGSLDSVIEDIKRGQNTRLANDEVLAYQLKFCMAD
jgi:hypothetical protein